MDSRHIQGSLRFRLAGRLRRIQIGSSGVEDTIEHIQGQAEHHREMTFKEEIQVFLKKHAMEYAGSDLE